MTKDEATAILSAYQHIHRKDADGVQALQMAIEALSDGKDDLEKMLEDLWNAAGENMIDEEASKKIDWAQPLNTNWTNMGLPRVKDDMNVMKNFQNEYEQKIKDGFVVTGTTTMTGIEDDGTVTASMWIEFEMRDKTEKEEEA